MEVAGRKLYRLLPVNLIAVVLFPVMAGTFSSLLFVGTVLFSLGEHSWSIKLIELLECFHLLHASHGKLSIVGIFSLVISAEFELCSCVRIG
jgi:hypothetical protein